MASPAEFTPPDPNDQPDGKPCVLLPHPEPETDEDDRSVRVRGLADSGEDALAAVKVFFVALGDSRGVSRADGDSIIYTSPSAHNLRCALEFLPSLDKVRIHGIPVRLEPLKPHIILIKRSEPIEKTDSYVEPVEDHRVGAGPIVDMTAPAKFTAPDPNDQPDGKPCVLIPNPVPEADARSVRVYGFANANDETLAAVKAFFISLGDLNGELRVDGDSIVYASPTARNLRCALAFLPSLDNVRIDGTAVRLEPLKSHITLINRTEPIEEIKTNADPNEDHRVGAGPIVDMAAAPKFAAPDPSPKFTAPGHDDDPDGKPCVLIPHIAPETEEAARSVRVCGLTGSSDESIAAVKAFFISLGDLRGQLRVDGDSIVYASPSARNLRCALAFLPSLDKVHIDGTLVHLEPLEPLTKLTEITEPVEETESYNEIVEDHRVGAGPDVDMSAPPKFTPPDPNDQPDGKPCVLLPHPEPETDNDARSVRVLGLSKSGDAALAAVEAFFVALGDSHGVAKEDGDSIIYASPSARNLRCALEFLPSLNDVRINGNTVCLEPLIPIPSLIERTAQAEAAKSSVAPREDPRVGAGPVVDMTAPPKFAAPDLDDDPDGKPCVLIPHPEPETDEDARSVRVVGLTDANVNALAAVKEFFVALGDSRGELRVDGDSIVYASPSARNLRHALAFLPSLDTARISGTPVRIEPLKQLNFLSVI